MNYGNSNNNTTTSEFILINKLNSKTENIFTSSSHQIQLQQQQQLIYYSHIYNFTKI